MSWNDTLSLWSDDWNGSNDAFNNILNATDKKGWEYISPVWCSVFALEEFKNLDRFPSNFTL